MAGLPPGEVRWAKEALPLSDIHVLHGSLPAPVVLSAASASPFMFPATKITFRRTQKGKPFLCVLSEGL